MVRVKIVGRNINLFFKRFFLNKIQYYGYKKNKYNEVMVNISYDDYLLLKNKSHLYEIEIVKLYGFLKIKFFFKENLIFITSFIISIIFLFILSNIIFDVQIIHNDKNIRTLVKDELCKYKIDKFSFIPSFDKRKKIIEKIINNNKDKIEWLEIDRIGSKIVVKLTERKMNKREENLPNRHIIASKSGIITKIVAEEGEIVKKKNDYVTKGEIIISGDIIKDDTVKGQVAAKGKVYAETWYKVNVEYPLFYEQITYLDEVKDNLILSFFGKQYALFKNYSEAHLENSKVLLNDKIFPFGIKLEKQRKIEIRREELSKDEAIKKAIDIATNKIKTKLDADEYIIDKKTLNFSSKQSKIIVDVFFKVNENITDYRNVDEISDNKVESQFKEG